MALEWLNGKNLSVKSTETVRECLQNYINSKENLLSPSSIRGYNIILKNSIDEIADIYISDLTERDLQNWINNNVKKYKPKSIKSQFGLVTASLRQRKISLDFKSILLPRIPRNEKTIPNEEQIATILHMVEGTSVELAVTIAVTLGLRQSEIAALT